MGQIIETSQLTANQKKKKKGTNPWKNIWDTPCINVIDRYSLLWMILSNTPEAMYGIEDGCLLSNLGPKPSRNWAYNHTANSFPLDSHSHDNFFSVLILRDFFARLSCFVDRDPSLND